MVCCCWPCCCCCCWAEATAAAYMLFNWLFKLFEFVAELAPFVAVDAAAAARNWLLKEPFVFVEPPLWPIKLVRFNWLKGDRAGGRPPLALLPELLVFKNWFKFCDCNKCVCCNWLCNCCSWSCCSWICCWLSKFCCCCCCCCWSCSCWGNCWICCCCMWSCCCCWCCCWSCWSWSAVKFNELRFCFCVLVPLDVFCNGLYTCWLVVTWPKFSLRTTWMLCR